MRWPLQDHAAIVAAERQEDLCPVQTSMCCHEGELEDIRAYKLGKGRWSYNKCSLMLRQHQLDGQGESKQLTVSKAAVDEQSISQQDGQLTYHLRLSNGQDVCASVCLVHSDPLHTLELDRMGENAQPTTGSRRETQLNYQWKRVSRGECSRGCSGCILRPLQRYGRLGRAAKNGANQGGTSWHGKARHDGFMYLSIDEACSHVHAKHFRLIVGVHDERGQCMLGSGCSQPIRVFSNNDCPTGAAAINIVVRVRDSWEGWNPRTAVTLQPAMQPPASGLQDSRMSTAGTPEAAWLMPEQLNVPHCHHDELKLHANQHHPSRAAAAVAAATANTAANAAYAGAANAASIPVPTSGASQDRTSCSSVADVAAVEACSQNDLDAQESEFQSGHAADFHSDVSMNDISSQEQHAFSRQPGSIPGLPVWPPPEDRTALFSLVHKAMLSSPLAAVAMNGSCLQPTQKQFDNYAQQPSDPSGQNTSSNLVTEHGLQTSPAGVSSLSCQMHAEQRASNRHTQGMATGRSSRAAMLEQPLRSPHDSVMRSSHSMHPEVQSTEPVEQLVKSPFTLPESSHHGWFAAAASATTLSHSDSTSYLTNYRAERCWSAPHSKQPIINPILPRLRAYPALFLPEPAHLRDLRADPAHLRSDSAHLRAAPAHLETDAALFRALAHQAKPAQLMAHTSPSRADPVHVGADAACVSAGAGHGHGSLYGSNSAGIRSSCDAHGSCPSPEFTIKPLSSRDPRSHGHRSRGGSPGPQTHRHRSRGSTPDPQTHGHRSRGASPGPQTHRHSSRDSSPEVDDGTLQARPLGTEDFVDHLKRKMNWHVDQLALEQCKVAALKTALQESDEEIHSLQAELAHVKNVKVPCLQDIRRHSSGGKFFAYGHEQN